MPPADPPTEAVRFSEVPFVDLFVAEAEPVFAPDFVPTPLGERVPNGVFGESPDSTGTKAFAFGSSCSCSLCKLRLLETNCMIFSRSLNVCAIAC